MADQAAFRIDYPEWLARLNHRDRRLAEFLVMGNTTGEAAQRFGLSDGRISQIRKELCNNWTNFHGAIEPWEAVRFARTRQRRH